MGDATPEDHTHDECLTVDLVAVAGESGHEAQHVAHVGRAGWKDWNVVRYARDGDFVFVTNNASDFRQLYAAQPLTVEIVPTPVNDAGDVERSIAAFARRSAGLAAMFSFAALPESVVNNRSAIVGSSGIEHTASVPEPARS